MTRSPPPIAAKLSLAVALLSCLAAAGCRRDRGAQPTDAASSAPPIDRVPPEELAEGPVNAFGLMIPRRLRVDARYPEEVIASGDVPQELVTKYVRERVADAHVENGAAKTVFADAHLKTGSADGGPAHVVRIEVALRAGRTELLIRDQTRPPATEGLSPDERWRRLGLNPDGTPIDPTHLE